ncbi:hypothetical protein K474DRAFT_1680977, partial [Panus rudis PR-1116 ss-1]
LLMTYPSQNGEVDVACEQAVSHVIHNCSLNASGTLLATGSENDVRIWEKDGEWWKEMQRLKSPPTYRDNHLVPMELVSLHWRKISRAKETLVTSYKRHGIQYRTSLSPDGSMIAAVMKNRFDIHSIKNEFPSFSLGHDGGSDNPITFAHDGEALIGSYKKGQVRLWISINGTRLQTLSHSDDKRLVGIAAYNDKSDHYVMVTASKDRVALWIAEETYRNCLRPLCDISIAGVDHRYKPGGFPTDQITAECLTATSPSTHNDHLSETIYAEFRYCKALFVIIGLSSSKTIGGHASEYGYNANEGPCAEETRANTRMYCSGSRTERSP